MKSNVIVILCLSYFIISCWDGDEHTKSDHLKDDRISKFDSLFTSEFKKKSFNGNVLIAEKGKVIFEKSYGISSLKDSSKLQANSVFNLASVTKQFTAMGIVLLQNEGKLRYDDDFTKYIPELSFYKGITIQNLLTHTSGLPDYMELADNQKDKSTPPKNIDVIQLYQKLRPTVYFEPNERFEYCNTGYLLMASIIERLSGMTYAEYLTQKIFKPLQMNETFVGSVNGKIYERDNITVGYINSDDSKSLVNPMEMGDDFFMVYLNQILGDGGLFSTTTDLLKWDRALFENKLISKEDKALVFSAYKTNKRKSTKYGFGWNLKTSENYGSLAYHSGNWAGYTSYIERFLDSDKTVIILQNHSTKATRIPIKNTRRILFNLPVEKPIQLSEQVLRNYTGTYIDAKNNPRSIVLDNKKLFVQFSPERRTELISVSPIKFILDGFIPEVTYTFSKNNLDKMECLIEQPENDIQIKLTKNNPQK